MSERASGAWAGFVAGGVMAAAMMGWMLITGRSPWINPNMISAMWLGEHAVFLDDFGGHTILGFATHQATSVLMGLIAIPFIRDLPRGRTLLVSSAYALASYPLVFSLVLRWANPFMVERTSMLPMTAAHAIFGVVMGAVYLRLRRGAPFALTVAGS